MCNSVALRKFHSSYIIVCVCVCVCVIREEQEIKKGNALFDSFVFKFYIIINYHHYHNIISLLV